MSHLKLFCHFTEEQKKIILKNHHTLHFFCHDENIEILFDHTKIENYIGYRFNRKISKKKNESFNINYDLIKDMYYQDSIKFKLDDNYPKLEYQDRRHRPSSTLHVGQIKLFLTTLQFLTDYVPKNKETHILYPGSAYGQNIHILSKLFPNCYWYLIDPLPFYPDLHNNNKILHMSNKFFTNKDAEFFKNKLKNKFTIFLCDIRNTFNDKDWDIHEIRISKDMYDQYNWCKIFNANVSFIKFRIPRFNNEYTYLDGDLIIQPFSPITSTESRLIVHRNAKDKIYYLDDYEDKMYYHNRILRVCNYSRLHNYEYKFFCNCFDCSFCFLILENYIKLYDSNISVYTLMDKMFKHFQNYNFFENLYIFITENIK